MNKTQDRDYPQDSLNALREAITQSAKPMDNYLELSIQFNAQDLNVREMAAYLEFLDRVYGRIVSDGLRSYAQRPEEQIQVNQFRSGSLEMIFQELITNLDKVSATIILGLVLKYLPDVLESLTTAYKNIEETKLIRLQREQLRKKLQEEEQLKSLKNQELNQLAGYLCEIYRIEQRHLPAAGRFADKYVQEIRMILSSRKKAD